MNRLIAAIDRRRGLAKQGFQPWFIPGDEQYFTDQTKRFGGRVLTGRRTYELSLKSQPLAGRQNYLLTHGQTPVEGVTLVHDLEAFLRGQHEELWIIGGAAVFAETMKAGLADELYLTHIDADFGCDQFFPPYTDGFRLAEESEPHEQNGFHFRYARYVKAA